MANAESTVQFGRTAMLLGSDGVALLRQKHVAVFGLGGVGGHLCEALARAGVGALSLFDHDTVAESNLNRQMVALHSTIGQPKVKAMARRIADIAPACQVTTYPVFYTPANAGAFPFEGYDYIADAIDTVSAKIELVLRARAAGVPIISAMGTGNKLHPERLQLTDITKTSTCPLARVMRKELKKRGVPHLKVVCSTEAPRKPFFSPLPGESGKVPPGSVSFVPASAGLIMAGAIVRDLLGIED